MKKEKFDILVFLASGDKAIPHQDWVNAFVEYCPKKCTIVSDLFTIFTQIEDCDIIFLPKSDIRNICILILSKIYRKKTILYIHEPLTLAARLSKSVPFFKAVLIQIYHLLETPMSSSAITGNIRNKRYCGKNLGYTPLLMPSLEIDCGRGSWVDRSDKTLYFGRLDSEKCFTELNSSGLPVEIIATTNNDISSYPGVIKRVSDADKRNIFLRHKFVWCVQKNDFSQSAVMLDALRHGCCLILRKGSLLCGQLHDSTYISVDIKFSMDHVQQAVMTYQKNYPFGPKGIDSVSRLSGRSQYLKHWEMYFEQ
jgi:hypothetical protein